MPRHKNGTHARVTVSIPGTRDEEIVFCTGCSELVKSNGLVRRNGYFREEETLKDNVERLLEQSMPIGKIAAELGISVFTIGRAAKQLGWRPIKVYAKVSA